MDKRPTEKIFSSIAAQPEMRIFWFALPFFFVIFAFDVFFLPPPQWIIGAGLLLAAGLVVLMSALRVASLNFKTVVERNELKSIVAGLDDALVVYDQNFSFLFFNAAAEKLFGVQAASVLGKSFKPQDAEDPVLRRLAQVVFPSLAPVVVNRTPAGSYPQTVDLSFEDPALELRVTTAIVDDGLGRTLGFMKLIRNRTRELFLMRSKSEFVTIASHQLRGPVTNLNWAIETLAKDDAIGETSKLIIANASAAAKQLMRIIEDLLNISKIEEGRFGYNFEVTNIVQFIDGVLAEVLPDARRVGISVYFDKPAEELPPAMIDRQKIKMALYNFLENAIRYNVKNGEVVVKVEKADNRSFMNLSVKDTGIGISPEEMKKTFSKFFRAENAMKASTEGTGLGLYIAKNIIRAHGGQVWAESELNRGSIFHFTLPTDFSLIPQHEVALEE